MSDWAQQMEQAEAEASAEWAKMMEARKAGDRRAENKAWRAHEKAKERARMARAMSSRWEVSSSGFAS